MDEPSFAEMPSFGEMYLSKVFRSWMGRLPLICKTDGHYARAEKFCVLESPIQGKKHETLARTPTSDLDEHNGTSPGYRVTR